MSIKLFYDKEKYKFKYKKFENKYILLVTEEFESLYISELSKIKELISTAYDQGIKLSKDGFSYKQLHLYQDKVHEISLKYHQVCLENFTFEHIKLAIQEDETNRIPYLHSLVCKFKNNEIEVLANENKYLIEKLFSLSSSIRPTRV